LLIAKWILQSRKRCGASEVDPPKFPVRDQGPREGLVSSLKYYSKTRIDKNRRRAPSGVGKTSQQKRHPVRSALKNGGAENFDGARVLRPRSMVSLFNRPKTGKGQFILWILELC
jgi:hypothetical protein